MTKGVQGGLEILYNEIRFVCKTETGKMTISAATETNKNPGSPEEFRGFLRCDCESTELLPVEKDRMEKHVWELERESSL